MNQSKDYESIRQQNKVIKMIPFNSDTKKMTVVIELEPDKKVRVFTKGASEILIDDCVTMLEKTGQDQIREVELDLSQRENIKEGILRQMAQKALRTMTLGYKDLSMQQYRQLISREHSEHLSDHKQKEEEESKEQMKFEKKEEEEQDRIQLLTKEEV